MRHITVRFSESADIVAVVQEVHVDVHSEIVIETDADEGHQGHTGTAVAIRSYPMLFESLLICSLLFLTFRSDRLNRPATCH